MSLPVVDVFVESRRFRCEVAVTDLERRKGLQGRRHLPADAGMLFVFDEPSPLVSFSMEDTSVPLDIIFLDERGRVTKVVTGEPRSKQQHVANARQVLEVSAGSGVKVGQQVGVRDMSHYTMHPEGIGQGALVKKQAAVERVAADRRASEGSAGPSSTGGSGDTEKKFPVVPVAIGAAVVAVLLLRRK